jgi:hypothetical protein
VSDPLDADDQVPRRPSDEYALNVEPQVVQTDSGSNQDRTASRL